MIDDCEKQATSETVVDDADEFVDEMTKNEVQIAALDSQFIGVEAVGDVEQVEARTVEKTQEHLDTKASNDEIMKKLTDEAVNYSEGDPAETFASVAGQFIEQFKDASIEQKQTAITHLYDAFDAIYKVKYRDKRVPIIFTKSGGFAFNHDGFIRVPLDEFDNRTPDSVIFSTLHEYRHAMQPSLRIESAGLGLPALTKLGHDMLPEEIDATKFAFENMDKLNLDKTKMDRYDEWQKAIRITDNLDLLKQNYNQETANNLFDIYKLLDEYTFQTNRNDLTPNGIFGKLHKIRTKFEFKTNINQAKINLAVLEKTAKLTGDDFLLKVVDNARADWFQYHL